MEQTLGKRIASNRKRMKLTQDQLAEKLAVTAQAVSKWENDQSCPDITTLCQLADIFGISIDELLGRTSSTPTHQGEIIEENESEGVHISRGGWEFHFDASRRETLIFAFLALLVGGLLLTARILSWDVSFWGILWPCTLLVFGIKGLRKFSVFSFGVTLFSGYSLLHNLGIWKLDIAGELVFPITVVLFGVGLLIDAIHKPKKPKVVFQHHGHNSKKAHSSLNENQEHFDCSTSFCENTHIISLDRLSSGKADTCFGELILDLTKCGEIADGCELDLSCSFGSMQLLIPKHCRVIADISTAFGSVDLPNQSDSNTTVNIHMNGSVSFGSIEIRYV